MSIITTPIQPPSTQPQQPVEPNKQPSVNEATPETSKPESMSPHFAALARKEKMIRERAREIAAKEQSFKTRKSELEQSINSKWKERLAQNTWDTLIEAGLTPEQVTQTMLNQPKPEELEFRNLRKELQDLKSEQQKTLENFQKQESLRYEQAKKQIGMDVKSLVRNNPEFEAISHFGESAENEVVNLIEEVFQNGWGDQNYPPGTILTIEVAAQKVEDYFFEQALTAAKLKKVQSKLIPATPVAQKPSLFQKPQVNTLSNRMSPSTQQFTDKQRKERAILRAQGIDPDSVVNRV